MGMQLIRVAVVALGVLAVSWALLIVLARRLPPGAAKDLATVLPACATTARRLSRDPRVPRRAKLAGARAALLGPSPIHPTPRVPPINAPLDDGAGGSPALRPASRPATVGATCSARPAPHG